MRCASVALVVAVFAVVSSTLTDVLLECVDDSECGGFGANSTCDLAAAATASGMTGRCLIVSTGDSAIDAANETMSDEDPLVLSDAFPSTTTAEIKADLLNPLTGVTDCAARSALCSESDYVEVMRLQCPNICGANNTSSATVCTDQRNPITDISDCPRVRSYCTDAVYESFMRVQCPNACRACATNQHSPSRNESGCVDAVDLYTNVSNCESMK